MVEWKASQAQRKRAKEGDGIGIGIKKKEESRRSARTTQSAGRSRGVSAEETFRSNPRCRLLPLPPPPDIDVHPLLDFLFRVLNINRQQFCTQYVECERSYAVYAYVCVCASALPCFPCLLLFSSPLFACGLAASGRRRGRGAGGWAGECTVPVSSWNPTRLFLIRFRGRDLRVGSWFGRCSRRKHDFIRRADASKLELRF